MSPRPGAGRPPLYPRVLRLRYIRPGGLLCFLYFEGALALGVLLALAELAPWWGALVLPVVVALMVKINDTVAGLSMRGRPVPAHVRPGPGRRAAARTPSVRSPVPMARIGTAGAAAPGRSPANLGVATARRTGSQRQSAGQRRTATEPEAGSRAHGTAARSASGGASVSARPAQQANPTHGQNSPDYRRGPNQGRFD